MSTHEPPRGDFVGRVVSTVVTGLFGDMQPNPPLPAWNHVQLPPGGAFTMDGVGHEASRNVGREVCSNQGLGHDDRNNSCTSSDEVEESARAPEQSALKAQGAHVLREVVRARAQALDLGVHLTDAQYASEANCTLYSRTPGEWYVKMLEQEARNTAIPPPVSALHPYDEWRRKMGSGSALVKQKEFEEAMSRIARRMTVIVSGFAPEGYVIDSDVITDDFVIDSQCTYITTAQESLLYWTSPRVIGRKALAEFRQHLYLHCRRAKEVGDWMEMLISRYYLQVEYEPDADYVTAATEFCKASEPDSWRTPGPRGKGMQKKPSHPFFDRKVRVGRLVVKQTMVNLLRFYNVSAVATIMVEGKTEAKQYRDSLHWRTEENYGTVAKFVWNALYPNGEDARWSTQTYALDSGGNARPKGGLQPRLPDPREWCNSITVPVQRIKRRHYDRKVYDVFGEDPWIMESKMDFGNAFESDFRESDGLHGHDRTIKVGDPYHTILIPQDAQEGYLRVSVSMAVDFPWTATHALNTIAYERRAHRVKSEFGPESRNPFDAIYPACTDCGPDLRITVPLGAELYRRTDDPQTTISVDSSVGKLVSFAFLVDAQVKFLYQVRASACLRTKKEMRIYGVRFKAETQVMRRVLAGLMERTHENPQIAASQLIAKQLLEHAI